MPQITPDQEALSNALDEALLEAVRNQHGAEEPNAAIFNAAINRLKALGITQLVTENSAAGQLAAECGLHDPLILRMPEIDPDQDTATGT